LSPISLFPGKVKQVKVFELLYFFKGYPLYVWISVSHLLSFILCLWSLTTCKTWSTIIVKITPATVPFKRIFFLLLSLSCSFLLLLNFFYLTLLLELSPQDYRLSYQLFNFILVGYYSDKDFLRTITFQRLFYHVESLQKLSLWK
jgi:hypothetical protein